MAPRKPTPKNQCKLSCCALDDADRARIKGTLEGWYAGKWAAIIQPGPTCSCTLAAAKGACPIHGRK